MGDVSYSESYTYNADGTLNQIAGSNGQTVTMSYDGLQRLSGKTVKQGDTTVVSYTYSYRNTGENATTTQIASVQVTAADTAATYAYTYDSSGNILSVSDGTNTTSYVYDSMNQLLRENNQGADKTWTWVYDNAGNIQSKSEYAYTTGELGEAVDTVSYSYTDENWSDLLTSYDGNTITYDEIGNPLNDGTWAYTWENGRQLASMTDGTTTWSYEYNADGLRTSRTNGTTTYEYTYNSDTLVQMVATTSSESETASRDVLYFTDDTVTYNKTLYYYIKNLQGDITYIVDSSGTIVVSYTYDAWGNVLSTSGTMANTLGSLNPLRYRGYVYDSEVNLYYLQSRYYAPEMGRFINADSYASTGQGILGNNMFAYSLNNPIMYIDISGERVVGIGIQVDLQAGDVCVGVEIIVYFDPQICNGEDFAVVLYTYSGASFSSNEWATLSSMLAKESVMIATELGTADLDTLLFALKAMMDGFSLSGGAFVLDVNEDFTQYSDYSGPFDSISASAIIKGVECTAFMSTCSTCSAYGIKVGTSTKPKNWLLPIDFSYSRTYYSDPLVLIEGSL